MNVIILDLPLFILGLGILVWALFFRPNRDFQILAQVVGTFFAVFSLGVTWSLDRFCLLGAAGLSRSPRRESGLRAYVPFVAYAVGASLLLSLGWKIPPGVKAAYGEARVLIQIAQFTLTVLAARAFAIAMQEEGAPWLLWILLRGAGVIHGLASLYQLLALGFGLPLLGISRAHGLVLDQSVGADIAAFTSSSGLDIIRPGGLAGEPKAASVIFGVVLFGVLVVGHFLDRTHWERVLTVAAGVFACFGFLVAFSTSSFAGAVALAIFLPSLSPAETRPRLLRAMVGMALLVVIGWAIFAGGADLGAILGERTLARAGEALDPPVAAAAQALGSDLKVLLFGTGLGGSSFLTMAYLNEAFEYAYAPNIGIVLLLVELGVLGTVLLLGVFAAQALGAFRAARDHNDPEILLLATLALSTMILCLVGSGIGVGFTLSLGTLAGAWYRAQVLPHDLLLVRQ